MVLCSVNLLTVYLTNIKVQGRGRRQRFLPLWDFDLLVPSEVINVLRQPQRNLRNVGDQSQEDQQNHEPR